MKKGKRTKLLVGSLCAAIVFADLGSAGILALAAEVETVQEMENAQETKGQAEIDKNANFDLQSENSIESTQIQSTENLENDTEAKNQMQAESVSENIEIAETEAVETEIVSENISESEIVETETQVVLNADGNIASGSYENITWVIDADGKLTVEGTGDFASPRETDYSRSPWYEYREKIKSAKIDVTEMTNASYMFYDCYEISDIDLGNFDTNNVTNMSGMFERCNNLDSIDISNFNTNNVTNMSGMFNRCTYLTSLDVSNFNTGNVTDMSYMFCDCVCLTNLEVSNFNTGNVTNMQGMYASCKNLINLDISNFSTSKVTNMSNMFEACISLTNLNVGKFSTSNVTDMSNMFAGCSSLEKLNLKNFDTTNVTNMSNMFGGIYLGAYFYGCGIVDLDFSSFNTSKVTNMSNMFSGCADLASLDLHNFNTSNVTDMSFMFWHCDNLKSLDISNFDTSNITDMSYMFIGCNNLENLNLRNFDTTNVTTMSYMFGGCRSLTNLDLSSFDTTNVTAMDFMFDGCNRLTSLDLRNFDVKNLKETSTEMFLDPNGSGAWCDNLSTIYTPCNLAYTVTLPANSGDKWYRSDGTIVTELPKNLSYSVVLGKNYIPEEKQPDLAESAVIELKDNESAILIYDTTTSAPVEGASVTIDNKSYPTNANGLAVFTATDQVVKKQVTVKASDYNNLTTYQQIKNKNLIRIGIEPSTGGLQVTSATASLGDKNFDLLREKYVLGYAETLDNFSNLTKDTLKLEITANKPDVTYELIATDKSIWTTPDKTKNAQTANRTSTNNSSDGSGGGGGSSWGGDGSGGGGTSWGEDADVLFTNTDGKFSIEVGTETVKIGNVDLEQTAVITILHPTENMYVRISDNEEHYVVKKLNLFTTHNYLTQEKTSQKDSFKLGKDLKVSVPDDIPFIGGSEYNFGFSDKTPVEMEIDEDGKIKIAINKPTDTKMEDFGRVYKNMEDAYKRMDKSTLNAMKLSGIKSFNAGLLKISGKVCGYGEGNIREIVSGNPTIELGIIAELEGKIGYQQRWIIGVVPIKIFVEASAKGSVDFQADVKFENWKMTDLDFSDGSFQITVGLDAGAGVGCEIIYELEVSVNGSLNYINKPGRNYQKIWLEASGKVQRTAAYFFEKTLWESANYQYTVFEDGKDERTVRANAPLSFDSGNATDADFQLMNRDYLNYTSGYNQLGQTVELRAALNAPENQSENTVIKSAVLPSTVPTLVECNGAKYLFWADDIPSRDDYNRTAFLYAKSADGTNWSSPERLIPESEDNTADFFYDVFVDNKNIYIVWQDADSQLTAEDTLTDIVKSLSIRYAVLDTTTDTVTDTGLLTDASGYYLYPRTVTSDGQTCFAYVHNQLDSGDIDGRNTQTLCLVTNDGASGGIPSYTTKKVTVPDNAQIANMDAGIFDGNPCLVCELDTDGDVSTNDDREIYLCDFTKQSLTKITDNQLIDTQPVFADSGTIYWYQDNAIMQISAAGQEPAPVLNTPQISGVTTFTVVTGKSGKDTILWETADSSAPDGSVSIFYTSENSDGSWSDVVRFAKTTGMIASKISAAGDGDSLLVAHTEGVFLENETELKDLCVTAKEETVDLVLESVDFDEEHAVAGNTLTLRTNVTNNGNTVIDRLEAVVENETVAALTGLDLKPYESRELEITGFRVPSNLKQSTKFTLTLIAPNETNTDDNAADFMLGCPDVFSESDYRIESGRTWLDLNIFNSLSYEASGKVLVHKGYEDGEVIFSKDYKKLNADNGYAYSVDLGDYEDTYTKYYIEVTSDTEENNVGNNVEFVYIGYGTGVEQAEQTKETYEITSVDLNSQLFSLGIGNSAQLSATDNKGNPFGAGELLWISSDKRIANIDQTGLVTAYRTGTTQITAYYGDLSCSCTVTVGEQAGTQTYTVWFDTQGGEEIAPITGITSGSLINLPSNAAKLGYLFDGWYTQPNGGEQIKGGTMIVTQTRTLYAHWMKDEDLVDIENQGDGLWISGIDKKGYSYLGEAIKPTIRVYDKTTLLTEKTDYTIAYKNNINVGKATIIVTGKGNYSGKESATFDILAADVSGDDFSSEEFFVKIGKKAQNPIPEIYYMGTKLKHKKDFTITYSNKSGVYAQSGKYSVTITGKGNYTGTRTLTLTAVSKIAKKPSTSIAKAALSGFEKSFPYTGKACRQQCVLSVESAQGKQILTEGTDYTVRYTNNVKAGTATVIYSGKNGYTGKLKKTYKIVPYNISDDYEAKINYENFFEAVYAKGGSKPKPVITFGGRRMIEGVDYTLSYKNNKTVYGKQMPCVIVNGKGSFKGKIPVYFSIRSQELSKMTLVSCDKVYKNKAGNYKIVPKLMDLDGKQLSAGKDFDKNGITYIYETNVLLENGISKNAGDTVEDTDIIPAGTQIRVTIESGTSGNYTGTFIGVYRIVKSDIKSAKVTIPNQTYTGKEIVLDKSQITVMLSGTKLKPEDYDIIQYTDNVKKGKASVTIKGNGNYGGTKTVRFTIGTKGFLWWWRKS